MKKILISLLLSSLILPSIILAKNHICNKKHPYALLSNDHGILVEADFKDERVAKVPFDIESKEFNDNIYWQCFPRGAITIQLLELGYSSEDIGWEENYGDLAFIAKDKKGIRHQYTMRRMWPVLGYLEKFKTWLNLMKHEKYVCIAGGTPYPVKDQLKSGNEKKVVWVFEQLKTKKGCDSYFENGCAQPTSKKT